MVELPSNIQVKPSDRLAAMNRIALSAVSTLVPVRLSAWFIRRFMMPATAAGLAADIPAKKAAAIVDALPTDYLIQTLQWIEPWRIGSLLAEITPYTAARIAKSLADARDFADMSVLVGYLSPESMIASVQVFHSGDDLLKVAVHVEDKRLLSPAILSLPTKKLPSLFSAADAADKWNEIFEIVDVMEPSTQRQLGVRLAELASSEISSFLRASLNLNTWPQLLDICLSLDESACTRLAASIGAQDEALHLTFMKSAKEQGRMQQLLKLVSQMPMHDQRRLVRLAGKNGIRITSVL